MNKLDLRQIGTITGLPVYVDFSSVPDGKDDDKMLSYRDIEEVKIRMMLKSLFGFGSND